MKRSRIMKRSLTVADTYKCQICGTAYRHRGMAERCTRTTFCRMYNTPRPEVLRMLRLVGGSAHMACFLAMPILDHGDHEDIVNAARKLDVAGKALFAAMRKAFPVAEHVARRTHDSIMLELSKFFPAGERVHMWYLGEVTLGTLLEAYFVARERELPQEFVDLLDGLHDRASELYAAMNPEDERETPFELVSSAEAAMVDALTGGRRQEREPSLYLVNERHLVVARGRADVRRVMMQFGLSRPHIEGIPHGEKFEDGRTATDIIKQSQKVPDLVGQMEA